VTGGGVKPALDLAFAPRGEAKLPELVRQDVPEIEVKAKAPVGSAPTAGTAAAARAPPGDRGAEEEERLRLRRPTAARARRWAWSAAWGWPRWSPGAAVAAEAS
jgi:hypothetical protein